MRKLRWVSSAFVCLCCTGLWAVGAPQVFVSTGSAGIIYSINTTTGTSTQFVITPGADYEGMVVAPYNVGPAVGDVNTHYLLYVCDPTNNTIVRFDPANPGPPDTLYDGTGSLTNPQCGRITASGDLIVSSTKSGSTLWKFTDVTHLPLGSLPQIPTPLASVAGSGEGLAQKNTGDVLVVDNTNNQVLRSNASAFATATPWITNNLASPFGIARRGDGFIYVSNQSGGAGNGRPKVVQFDATGNNATTCTSFTGNDVPYMMQMALDNTLYVAVSGGNSGSVRAVNAATCKTLANYSLKQPAVGVALAPTMNATLPVSASNGVALINFGYAAFEINQISGACGGTLSVSIASPAAIQALIALSQSQADPAINLGLDGFEAVFNTANVTGCSAKDGKMYFQASNLFSNGVINPELVVCDDANTNCQPGTTGLLQIGFWPLGGYLPLDATSMGTKSGRCNIFMANAHPAVGTAPGLFCGFQSPLTNTYTGSVGNWDVRLAANITDGKSVPVKFKMASTGGACQNGPYITSGLAMLSVSQIADSKGNPTFVTIGLISNGSSGLAQPLFKSDTNQQYLFNWDSSSCIMPSGVTQVCPKGTYALTVVLLTDNTDGNNGQSVYGVQTTLVVLK